METTRDLTLSFYDDYGVLSIYAKQFDSQRVVQFEFNEDIIPEDREHFHICVRGKYSNGIIISPFEIDKDDIDKYTVTFHIPSYFLKVSGRAVCDLLLSIGNPEFDPDGTISNRDQIQILSTHNFNIYVDAMPTEGARLDPVQEDQMDMLTRLLIEAQTAVENLGNYEEEIYKARNWIPI